VSLFETLEAVIACAAPTDEPQLLARALATFGAQEATQRLVAAFVGAGAFAQAAIALHRAAMPNGGYQFGEVRSGRGLASIWRRGDAHALPFEAATPGLALLRATAHQAARALESETRSRCAHCRGRGWVITRDGGKRICAHGETPCV
jgi:hypothetical protein